MNELDFGVIMEKECWFEDYDLSCPICDGQGERESRTWKCKCKDEDCKHEWEVKVYENDDEEAYEAGPDECPKCDYCNIELVDDDTETEHCESCTEGHFEIMWNKGYAVHLRYRSDFETERRDAWEMGWLLIEHNNEHYLLAGGCGYDFTWKLHHARWKLQGYLDLEDIRGFIRSDGHVFLGAEEKAELLRYCRSKIPTPNDYAASYRAEVDSIDRLLFPEPKKEEAEEDARSCSVHV